MLVDAHQFENINSFLHTNFVTAFNVIDDVCVAELSTYS